MSASSTSGVHPLARDKFESLLAAVEVSPPIEQTEAWYRFEETLGDREFLGFFEVILAGNPVAVLALQRVEYHGTKFLWSKNGPLWLVEPTLEVQTGVVEVLVSWVKATAPLTPFIRLHLTEPVSGAQPPLQIVTYDRTVVLDSTGGADQIMQRFSKSGRRNLRASLRKTPIEVFDETEEASTDFSKYHEIMQEVAKRQEFNAWPASFYQDMLQGLGSEHSRLFAGRVDGELVAWGIFTLSGNRGSYYYAAANEQGRRRSSSAQVLYSAAQELGKAGVEQIDLMGIGSDLAPSLAHLSAFKRAFAQQETVLAPAWDVPVNHLTYKLLVAGKDATTKLRGLSSALREKRSRKAEEVSDEA